MERPKFEIFLRIVRGVQFLVDKGAGSTRRPDVLRKKVTKCSKRFRKVPEGSDMPGSILTWTRCAQSK